MQFAPRLECKHWGVLLERDAWLEPYRKAWHDALADQPTSHLGDDFLVAIRIAKAVGQEFGVKETVMFGEFGLARNRVERMARLACLYVARRAFGMRPREEMRNGFCYRSPWTCESNYRRAKRLREVEPVFRETTDRLVRRFTGG